MQNERLKNIYEVASRLFIQQGYAKTQISHIAKGVGVSVGTIYLDFAGKKEILYFVLKCTITPEFINHSFERPITDNNFENLEQEISVAFNGILTEFRRALSDKAEGYSFERLISEV